MEYIVIFIAAVFVNNIVLSQFLGICPFLGVSKKISTAIGMGAAVTFVMTLSTIVTFLLQKYLLNQYGLGFMQTIVFILVIAALVPGFGCIFTTYHHQLRYFGSGYYGDTEKFRLDTIRCFRHIDRNRIYIGFGYLCRNPRTVISY